MTMREVARFLLITIFLCIAPEQHKEGNTMKTSQLPPTQQHDATYETPERNIGIDFSHPDIVRARAKVYALLLAWRREREAQGKRTVDEGQDGLVNVRTNLRNSADPVYCVETESPTPAATEAGQR